MKLSESLVVSTQSLVAKHSGIDCVGDSPDRKANCFLRSGLMSAAHRGLLSCCIISSVWETDLVSKQFTINKQCEAVHYKQKKWLFPMLTFMVIPHNFIDTQECHFMFFMFLGYGAGAWFCLESEKSSWMNGCRWDWMEERLNAFKDGREVGWMDGWMETRMWKQRKEEERVFSQCIRRWWIIVSSFWESSAAAVCVWVTAVVRHMSLTLRLYVF